jgi:hypothetical protein
MSNLIKIKNLSFYHAIDNRFYANIGTFTGHGIISTPSNQLFEGVITNPTGIQPAVFYKTGTLIGQINDGSGSYFWPNLTLQGAGEPGKVYLNYATGYVPASNILEFINDFGQGLQNNDIINISNFSFIFSDIFISPPVYFNSPETLINILNSGATGAYNDLGFSFLETSIGITGYQLNNKLFLFSYFLSGEDGNNIKIYKDIQNDDALKIYNRYFTGGKTFRPLLQSWIGNFESTFNLNIENSGFYRKNYGPVEFFQNLTGVLWEDNFDKNYTILTGFKNPANPILYSGVKIPFNNQINQYSGFTRIPRGQTRPFTGINIEIIKPNPYNISGNIAEYIVSGDDFIFKGFIEG